MAGKSVTIAVTTALFQDHALVRNLMVWVGLALLIVGVCAAVVSGHRGWGVLAAAGIAVLAIAVPGRRGSAAPALTLR